MKIVVLSDMHFGHAPDRDREKDPYRAVAEVAERTADADFYIIPGDLFDMKIPSPETLANAIESLTELALGKKPKEAGPINPAKTAGQTMQDTGLPNPSSTNSQTIRINKLLGGKVIKNHPSARIIAIHGTHERRAKDLVNPVQILEKAGLLIHLNNNGIILEKTGGDGSGAEKVAIQGLGGVPDQYTEQELRAWGPRPVSDCLNIFMLHQNMTEFMPKQVEHTLDKEKLPIGFDIYLNGHIHRPEQSTVHGKPLIICGSLIPTQVVKDSTKPLGFWVIETDPKGPLNPNGSSSQAGSGQPPQIGFKPLKKQRRIFIKDVKDPGKDELEAEIKKAIESGSGQGSETDDKPIIRINVKGKLDRQQAKAIQTRFGDKAIITIKHELEEEQIKGRSIEEHRLSVNELGAKLLDENLKAAKLDPQVYSTVFELLLHGKQKEAMDLLETPTKIRSYVIEKQPEERPKPKEPIKGLEKFGESGDPKNREEMPESKEKPEKPTTTKPKGGLSKFF